jgi:hypothetical protein
MKAIGLKKALSEYCIEVILAKNPNSEILNFKIDDFSPVYLKKGLEGVLKFIEKDAKKFNQFLSQIDVGLVDTKNKLTCENESSSFNNFPLFLEWGVCLKPSPLYFCLYCLETTECKLNFIYC